MGTINSKNVQALKISSQWKFEAANATSRIFKNHKGQIAEELFVNFTSNQQMQKMMETYFIRKTTSDVIINTYGAEVVSNQGYFCSNSIRIRVLIQYFPKKLDNIKPMSTQVLAYTLSQALRGFKQLFSIFGRIKIDKNLIAISNSGIVKVWTNSNFALNRSQQFSNDNNLFSKQQQIKMVKDVLSVIQPYCKGGNYPIALINYFNRAHVLDFDSILSLMQRYKQDIQPKHPLPQRDCSIIDTLLNNSQASTCLQTFSGFNKNILPFTSSQTFYSNLSKQVNERITDNITTRNSSLQKDSNTANLKRIASIPMIRPYRSPVA